MAITPRLTFHSLFVSVFWWHILHFTQTECQGDDGNAKIVRGPRDQEKTVPLSPDSPLGDDGQVFAKECWMYQVIYLVGFSICSDRVVDIS